MGGNREHRAPEILSVTAMEDAPPACKGLCFGWLARPRIARECRGWVRHTPPPFPALFSPYPFPRNCRREFFRLRGTGGVCAGGPCKRDSDGGTSADLLPGCLCQRRRGHQVHSVYLCFLLVLIVWVVMARSDHLFELFTHSHTCTHFTCTHLPSHLPSHLC